jgi:hypothetical protein
VYKVNRNSIADFTLTPDSLSVSKKHVCFYFDVQGFDRLAHQSINLNSLMPNRCRSLQSEHNLRFRPTSDEPRTLKSQVVRALSQENRTHQ